MEEFACVAGDGGVVWNSDLRDVNRMRHHVSGQPLVSLYKQRSEIRDGDVECCETCSGSKRIP